MRKLLGSGVKQGARFPFGMMGICENVDSSIFSGIVERKTHMTLKSNLLPAKHAYLKNLL